MEEVKVSSLMCQVIVLGAAVLFDVSVLLRMFSTERCRGKRASSSTAEEIAVSLHALHVSTFSGGIS